MCFRFVVGGLRLTLLALKVRLDIFSTKHTSSQLLEYYQLPPRQMTSTQHQSSRHHRVTVSRNSTKMPVSIKTPIVASLTAQERFAQNIDQNGLEQAMFWYQEFMHQHAMEQFEHANALSRMEGSEIERTRAPLLNSDSTSSTSSTAS
jgi:hypothetical protein